MSHETTLTTHYVEKATGYFSGVLKDELDALMKASELVSLVLYLYNDSDKAIINSRSGTDILNANGGAMDEAGNWSLTLSGDDMAISDATKLVEMHVAEIHWVYNGGSKNGAHRIRFPVHNFEKIS